MSVLFMQAERVLPQVSKRVVMFQPGFLPQLQRGGGKHIIRIGQPFSNCDDTGACYYPASFTQCPHRVRDFLQDGDIKNHFECLIWEGNS